MFETSHFPTRLRWLALAVLATLLSSPTLAQECPAGQRRICFPGEAHFEYWRSASTGVAIAKEEVWFSESRQKSRSRLRFAASSFNQYFDYTAHTVTIVEIQNNDDFSRCDQFPTTDVFISPCPAPACLFFVEEANFGALTPIERWVEMSGVTQARDVLAERLGEELIPLRLINRLSSTIHTSYMNFRSEIDDLELEVPCTPNVFPGSAEEALRKLEQEHGLPAGTLTGSEVGQ